MGEPQHGLEDSHFRDDPYPVYARLREHAPVHFAPSWNGWLVTRYRDVLAGFRDPRLSANRSSGYAAALPEPVREKLQPLIGNLAMWALLIDPPAHTRLRSLINAAMTPRIVEALRPRIAERVDRLLDAASEKPVIDAIADLATPLPVQVIGELLGLPYEDSPRLKSWSDSLAAFMGASRLSMEIAGRAVAGVVEMEDYFRGAIAERRARPTADLLSSLIRAESEGAILGEQELLSTCSMVLFGGHETTTNLVANALHLILTHPTERAALAASDGLYPSAVEEVLRFDSPVQRMGRVAKEDIEWHGRTIERGQRVFLVMGAANRDPEQFPDPDRLDLARRDNRHLSLGMGAHYCVGAALGRIEAQIALSSALRRFPDMKLTDAPLHRVDNLTIRGFESLPVELN